MLSILMAVLMPYQTVKLDKASFDLIAPVQIKKIIKDIEPEIKKEEYQVYTSKRRGKSFTNC